MKKIEIESIIFSNNDPLKMEGNYIEKWRNNFTDWKLNNSFLNNHLVRQIIRGNKKLLEANDNEHMKIQNVRKMAKPI